MEFCICLSGLELVNGVLVSLFLWDEGVNVATCRGTLAMNLDLYVQAVQTLVLQTKTNPIPILKPGILRD